MSNAPKSFVQLLALCESQSTALRAELARLDSLIDDAGNRLLASFVAMQDAIEGASLNGTVPATQLLDTLAPAVSEAIGALQFQDLARQLIGHAAERVGAIEDGVERLLVPGLEAECNLTLPRNAGPVAQQSMAGGSIELF